VAAAAGARYLAARQEVGVDRDEFIRVVEEANPHTVFGPLGIRITRYDPDEMQIAMEIDERHRQHLGVLHGGVSALLAESVASLAAAMSVDLHTHTVAGVDLNVTHVRAKRTGSLLATARPLFRGRTTQVYAVEVTDETGALVCAARCTIAVRPRRASERAG
jgi:1,4-dihydroxy-2-naphthoyl-CoA hydrolase